ncbi:MAG: hypothetical protein ACPGNV_09850 [Mangrovicoccus sp.]
MAETLTINFAGPFRMHAGSGADLPLKSKRAQAILLFLACSPKFRVSRTKLKSLLWADRSPKQANDSLRQDLKNIRIALGLDLKDILKADNIWVSLDPERVEIGSTPPENWPKDETPIFADGLEVPHTEFQTWLEKQRADWQSIRPAAPEIQTSPAPTETPAKTVSAFEIPNQSIFLELTTGPNPDFCAPCDLVIGDALCRAADTIGFDMIFAISGHDPKPDHLILRANASEIMGQLHIRVALVDNRTGTHLWWRNFRRPLEDHSDIWAEICQATTFGVISGASNYTVREKLAAVPPWQAVFGYEKTSLFAADEDLLNRDPDGRNQVFLTLRAFIRNTLLFERMAENEPAVVEEVDELLARARAIRFDNAFTLAVSSLFAWYRNDVPAAVNFAERAKKIDPENGFARATLSMALSHFGKKAEALREISMAGQDEMVNLYGGFIYGSQMVVALANHDKQAALLYARRAHKFAPEFRPALRFKAALEYDFGLEEEAFSTVTKLKILEPDFSTDTMRHAEYPVDSLRAAGVTGLARSGLI